MQDNTASPSQKKVGPRVSSTTSSAGRPELRTEPPSEILIQTDKYRWGRLACSCQSPGMEATVRHGMGTVLGLPALWVDGLLILIHMGRGGMGHGCTHDRERT
jgi:hypothetical protein